MAPSGVNTLLLCFAAAWLLGANAGQHRVLLKTPQGASSDLSPEEGMEVKTDVQLIAALRDPSVTLISIPENLTLTPETFNRLVPVGQPILVQRNVTVRGGPELPALDLAYIAGRVTLAPGVVFTYDSLLLLRERFEATTQGDDLMAPSPNASVVLYQCWVLWESCYPPETWDYAAKMTFTQIGGPGVPAVPYNNSVTLIPQGICHPFTGRCWKTAGYFDVLVETWATDQDRIPGTGWTYYAKATTAVCNLPVSLECIQLHSLKTCLALMREAMDEATGAGPADGGKAPGGTVLDSGMAGEALPGGGAGSSSQGADATGGGGSGSSGTVPSPDDSSSSSSGPNTLIIALPVALGGAALLAGLAVFGLAWRRLRGRSPAEAVAAEKTDAEHQAEAAALSSIKVHAADGYSGRASSAAIAAAGVGGDISAGGGSVFGLHGPGSKQGQNQHDSPAAKHAPPAVHTMSSSIQGDSTAIGTKGIRAVGGSRHSVGSAGTTGTVGSYRPAVPQGAPAPVQEELRQLLQNLAASDSSRLEVGKCIGQGGYGTVHKGRWRNMDVAVKTIHFHYMSADAFSDASSSKPLDKLDVPVSPAKSVAGAVLPSSESDPIHAGSGSHDLVTGSESVATGSARPSAPSLGSCEAKRMQGHNQQQESKQQQEQPGGQSCPPASPLKMQQQVSETTCRLKRRQQQALWEAAVCASIVHPNVVSTYHFDVVPVQTFEEAHGLVGGLQIDDTRSGEHFKLYLVQEYCPTNLTQLADQWQASNGSSMPLDLVLMLLGDVARGMAYLHSRNIVHGDLTPANILIAPPPGPYDGLLLSPLLDPSGREDGPANQAIAAGPQQQTPAPAPTGYNHSATNGTAIGQQLVPPAAVAAVPQQQDMAVAMQLGPRVACCSCVAKLCDFGLSHSLDPGRTHVSNVRQGTPFYTAPEILSMHKLTPASDVWSFGVIAWEVYHGQKPWLLKAALAQQDTAATAAAANNNSPAGQPDNDKSNKNDEDKLQRSDVSYDWNPQFPRWDPRAPPELARLALSCLLLEPASRPTFAELSSKLDALFVAATTSSGSTAGGA